MIKVDSAETIYTLATRFLKNNKKRNIIAIIAIILTSVLFTSVFTASFSVVKSTRDSQMRMAMDTSHVTVQNLTKEQYERVSKDREIIRQGMNLFLTLADNEELKNIQTEIRYADRNSAQSYSCLPTSGKLPQKEDELATSTKVLDALGIPHKLSEKVKLIYTLDHQQIEKEFTLSGFWKGDSVPMAQLAWVSKTYCERVAPMATTEGIMNGDYEGTYNMSIWLSNSFGLEKKAIELAERCGLVNEGTKVSANPAYNLFEEDAFPFGAVAMILLIIASSGYLIIYNIFIISVNLDIHTYGLLKSIGTSGRQLKKMVILQAFFLSMIGIPMGLFIGFFIGKCMTPFLLSDLGTNGEGTIQTVISLHPLIFLLAGLFSLMTVYLGCVRPCHIVAKLSPIEAVRLTQVKSHKKTKRSGGVTTLAMAYENMRRTWKKALAVIISLSLSLIVLNSVYMIVMGFDFNRFIGSLINADFEVSQCTTNLNHSVLNSVTPAFMERIEQNENVASVGYVYFTRSTHRLEEAILKNLKEEMKPYQQKLSTNEQKEVKNIFDTGKTTSHILGINEAIFHKLIFDEGDYTWEDFASGNYVIASAYGNFYEAKDKVKLEFDGGKSKEYTVLTVAELPLTLDYPFYDGRYLQAFMLPQEEYVKETGNHIAMMAAIDAKEGHIKSVSGWLTDYINENNHNFVVNSRLEMQKQFEGYVNKYYMVGGLLTAVLFVIGMMNFFNTSATSILSRKKELSLLEVVGMTKKQIKKMLVMEGFLYIGFTLILTLTVGQVFATKIIDILVGRVFFFECHPSFLPSILAIPWLMLIAGIIPAFNYKSMCKQTMVERLVD